MALFFEIEKHFALGGGAIGYREIKKMIPTPSDATALRYVGILVKWGLVNHSKGARTITLAKTNYPPVAYMEIPNEP